MNIKMGKRWSCSDYPEYPRSFFLTLTPTSSSDKAMTAHLSACLLLPPAGFNCSPTHTAHSSPALSMLVQNPTHIISWPTSGPCCLWFLRAVRVHPHPGPGPKGLHTALPHPLFTLPYHTPSSHTASGPEKAALTPASGPLLFSLPEMLFSGPSSTSRAQFNQHLPDLLLSQTDATSPTALPVVTPPSMALPLRLLVS